jgi:RNA polymerase sigma-54 factor
VPDLIVEPNDSGGYDVRLVDDYTPQLAVSRQYRHLMRGNRTDRETRQFLMRKIESARWLIEAIQQRRNTILLVAQAIIDHQRNFLDIGPEAIEPLKMQQIADRVGRHVTTVSRAVDEKWVQTPRGIFPLKGFFGGGAKSADGEEVAWETIKQKLIEIIANEDKRNPLSDDEIAEKLKEACGIPVARRTVTKYRKEHNIPSSRGRKKH